MLAVDAKGITKTFGKVKALDNVSLRVEEGEVFGMLGPNGAGKTTLVSVLASLLTPDSGSAKVFSRDVVEDSLGVRKMINMCSAPSYFEDMGGRENLEFFGRLYNLPEDVVRKRAQEMLKLVGLQRAANKLVEEYSTGMLQRLGIAKAMMSNPKLLILDEPTMGLDIDIALKIRKMIKKLPGKGITILLTTHYMEEADFLCDRIAFINNGRIVAEDTPAKLKSMVKDYDILRIEFEEMKGSPITALKGIPGIHSHSLKGNLLEVMVDDCDKRTHSILHRLFSKGFKVKCVDTRRPTLEDAFLKFTGRRLA